MQRFNAKARGCEMKMGVNGYGKRLRDGSCAGFGQGLGQGRGLDQCPNWIRPSTTSKGQGVLDRFLGNARQASSPTGFGLDSIKSAIDDLQRQINELRSHSGK